MAAFAAMVPEPPGLFSTITCPLRIGAIAFARMRAMVSTVPPAAKPTRMRIGRSGKAARAMRGASRPALDSSNARRVKRAVNEMPSNGLTLGERRDERVDVFLIRPLAASIDARTGSVADPQHDL